MRISWLSIVILPTALWPHDACAFDMWAGKSPAPLGEYLNRPFRPSDACLYGTGDALTAADTHVLGAPKQLVNTFITYNDDGAIDINTRTVTRFSFDGRILDSTESDSTGEKRTVSKSVLQYDLSNHLKRIDRELPLVHETCTAVFFYDKAKRLFRITASPSDDAYRTIDITYYPDGRFKEAIERKPTGRPDWRIVYTYTKTSTMIERYSTATEGEEYEKASFQFDRSMRPVRVSAETRTSLGDEAGVFAFKYLKDGITVAHVEETQAEKLCIFDYSLHHNGAVDLKSINVWGEHTFWCSKPNGTDSTIRAYFDHHGNEVVDREGDEVEELGRNVMHWKYVTMNAISYY